MKLEKEKWIFETKKFWIRYPALSLLISIYTSCPIVPAPPVTVTPFAASSLALTSPPTPVNTSCPIHFHFQHFCFFSYFLQSP